MPLRSWIVTVVVFAALTSGVMRAGAEESVRIEVRSNPQAGALPVHWTVPQALSKWKHFRLVDEASGREVPVQSTSDDKRASLTWMHLPGESANGARRYRITNSGETGEKPEAGIIVRQTEKCIEIEVEGKPVLHYNHAVVPSGDPEKPFYRRSGFIHPLFDPKGNVLTDGMPTGTHMHQHGVMFAWVDTTFEGRPVDFWNSAKQQGEVRHAEIEALASGPVFGEFRVRLEHVDLTAPSAPKVALNETWRVRVYRRTYGFLFDLHSTQACAGNNPLTVNKYHYGGMAIRGLGEWKGANGCQFLTSEGKNRETGNESRPRWCDISGPVAGAVSGATLFCSPQNLRAPQPVRLNPSMPYFCFSPPIIDAFTIEPGRPLESRYRFYLHAGALDTSIADAIGDGLAEPLQVELVSGE